MGWIFIGLFMVVVISRFVGKAGRGRNDFPGNNMDSYFLLDEFMDERSGDKNEPVDGEILYTQDEDWL